MDDKIYNEIKKKADVQFLEYLAEFKQPGNEKDYDKFITLIFKDIIKVDIVNNKSEYIQIIDNQNYCTSFFDIYNEKLNKVPGLASLVKEYMSVSKEDLYIWMEFVLHGLAEHSQIGRQEAEGNRKFTDLFGSLMQGNWENEG